MKHRFIPLELITLVARLGKIDTGLRQGSRGMGWARCSQNLVAWFLLLTLGGLRAEEMPVYQDANQPIDARVQDLVGRMTVEEKVAFVSGNKKPDKFLAGSPPIPRLKIPGLRIVHGPFGFKGYFPQETSLSIGTYFPVSVALASTWDVSLMEAVAAGMGAEMQASGGHINDGPAINIVRDPRCGRNFEYFTEDPFLNGKMALAYTVGIQSQRVMSGPKHFACNNQELNRGSIDVIVTERALREIYFPGFEMAVREGGAMNIMGAYNKINGVYCCENTFLLQQVLRDEWGFNGFVQSDSGATHSTERCALAGTDLEMSREVWYGKKMLAAVKDGRVTEATLNTMVGNILCGMFWAGAFDTTPSYDKAVLCNPQNLKLARDAAAQSMVLLKNDAETLPLDLTKLKKIAVIGPNGEYGAHYNNGVYDVKLLQGGGSSSLKKDRASMITPYQGIKDSAGAVAEVLYAPGCYAENGCGTIPSKYLRTPDGQQEGLLVSFYRGMQFSGEPFKTEVNRTISYLWKEENPFPEAGLNNDDGYRFGVVWQGILIAPETRKYTFSVRNYSGCARLFINGRELVVNAKGSRREWTAMAPIELKAGQRYEIRAEYTKLNELADFRLEWDYENVQWMKEAVELAEAADAVVLTVGLSGESGETESGDRTHLRLFPAQEQLIHEVARVNPNVVVAIIAGSAIDMRNWLAEVPAVLMAWYPGQQGGYGLADVLLGRADPGGRLPVTFPLSLEQYPDDFYALGETIEYKEGVFVGYRYFDQNKLQTLFPFGYGLSYTTFAYGAPSLSRQTIVAGESVEVAVPITNRGSRAGSDVVQLYVHDPVCSVPRPPAELKAFKKVFLKPGETQVVTFTLDKRAFAYFSEEKRDWVVEPGRFDLRIGASSRDVRQTIELTVN